MQAARDVPLLILSENTSSERRITPTWSIARLKARLEPVTGIPPSCQKLVLRVAGETGGTAIEAEDEEATRLDAWNLVPGGEILVGLSER
jgi:tubulin-specific chaperone B